MMMNRSVSRPAAAAAGLALLVLSGCAAPGLNSVAGAELGATGFGAATEGNMRAMTGSAEAIGHLGARFAAEVPTTVNFAFGSAALDAAARATLDRQAEFMRAFPEARFSVYGHTDKVGPNAANERLGLARARAAVAHLVARGVSSTRLAALVSYGETRPLVPVPSAERANRRTVTEVSGFVAGNPLVLDGNYGRIVYRGYVGSGANRGQEVSGGGGEGSVVGAGSTGAVATPAPGAVNPAAGG